MWELVLRETENVGTRTEEDGGCWNRQEYNIKEVLLEIQNDGSPNEHWKKEISKYINLLLYVGKHTEGDGA